MRETLFHYILKGMAGVALIAPLFGGSMCVRYVGRLNSGQYWFSGGLGRKVGMDNSIRFWEDAWLGNNV